MSYISTCHGISYDALLLQAHYKSALAVLAQMTSDRCYLKESVQFSYLPCYAPTSFAIKHLCRKIQMR